MQIEPSVDSQPLDGDVPTTSPEVRLGSSSVYQLTAQVFGLATSFVASVLIARSLGPVGKGQLSVLQQVPGVLTVLLNLGIAGANTYFVGTGKTKPGTALGNSLLFASAVGTLGLPVIWLMTAGPLSVVKGLSNTAALLAAITLPLGLAASYVAAIVIAQGRVRRASVSNIVGSAISVVVIVGAYATGRLGLIAALGASLLAAGIGLYLNMSSVIRHADRVTASWRALRASAKYSLKSYLSNLAGYLNYRQDILLVGYLAGAASVGIYSISVTFAELMWYIPNSVATALLAKSLSKDKHEAHRLATQTSRIVSVLTLVVMLITSAILVPVIRFFYGEAFVPAAGSFFILLPGAWLLGIASVLGAYLASRGYLYPHVSIIAAVGNFLLNLIFIPRLGFRGAALASAISYVYLGLQTAWYFRRDTGARWVEIIVPRREDWNVIIESAAGYGRRLLKR